MNNLEQLEQEIIVIKNTLAEALNEGRGALAIFGKFDILFQSINALENKILDMEIIVNKYSNLLNDQKDKNIECSKIDKLSNKKLKGKRGRPPKNAL